MSGCGYAGEAHRNGKQHQVWLALCTPDSRGPHWVGTPPAFYFGIVKAIPLLRPGSPVQKVWFGCGCNRLVNLDGDVFTQKPGTLRLSDPCKHLRNGWMHTREKDGSYPDIGEWYGRRKKP